MNEQPDIDAAMAELPKMRKAARRGITESLDEIYITVCLAKDELRGVRSWKDTHIQKLMVHLQNMAMAIENVGAAADGYLATLQAPELLARGNQVRTIPMNEPVHQSAMAGTFQRAGEPQVPIRYESGVTLADFLNDIPGEQER